MRMPDQTPANPANPAKTRTEYALRPISERGCEGLRIPGESAAKTPGRCRIVRGRRDFRTRGHCQTDRSPFVGFVSAPGRGCEDFSSAVLTPIARPTYPRRAPSGQAVVVVGHRRCRSTPRSAHPCAASRSKASATDERSPGVRPTGLRHVAGGKRIGQLRRSAPCPRCCARRGTASRRPLPCSRAGVTLKVLGDSARRSA